MEEKLPEVLNWQQACKVLGCSRSHFYNLVNSGELPALRLGRIKGLRVNKNDCIIYLDKKREA